MGLTVSNSYRPGLALFGRADSCAVSLAGLPGPLLALLLSVGICQARASSGLRPPDCLQVKWFPDKKAITGIAVAGFGLGAMLWIMLTGGFKLGDWFNLTPGWDGLYADGWTVNQVFRLYGFIFAVFIPIGSFFMVNPPAGQLVNAANGTSHQLLANIELTTSEMICTAQYWILLSGYAAGTMSGLMVIGIIKLLESYPFRAMASPGQAAGLQIQQWASFIRLPMRWDASPGGVISTFGRKSSISDECFAGMMMMLFYPMPLMNGALYRCCVDRL